MTKSSSAYVESNYVISELNVVTFESNYVMTKSSYTSFESYYAIVRMI